ncbi:MAG: hypothetical protein ACI9IO_002299, partial [Cyanobium sp.]
MATAGRLRPDSEPGDCRLGVLDVLLAPFLVAFVVQL